MNCDQIVEQISAWIDGELDAERAREVDVHLHNCSECKVMADQMRAVDKQLCEEFALPRVAGKVVTDRVINLLPLHIPVRSTRSNLSWRASLTLLTAAAVGFLLASFTIPREDTSSRNARKRENFDESIADGPFASVSLATGPFQVAPIAAVEFAQFDSHLLEVGTKLRTGSHKTELLTSKGTILRLDVNTELSLPSSDQVILESGRLMCSTERDASDVAIESCGTTINVAHGSCDIRCVDSNEVELIALDGDVKVNGKDWQNKIEAGRKVRLAHGKIINEDRVANPVIETRWVHELLRQKSPDNGELLKRVDRLWASLGFSKVQNLYEEELRALGPSCVHPLTSFLASDQEVHRKDHRRSLAATLVADLADYESIPRLIQLLNDRDLDVGMHMARGLSRITGRHMIVPPDQWRTTTPQQRAEAARKWAEWLSIRESNQASI